MAPFSQLREPPRNPGRFNPRFVAPYRAQGRSGKNDRNDAAAIAEAAGRPQMHFVPIKTAEQQALLLVHRRREALVQNHTRTINRMRGALAEFGIIAAKGADLFKQRWPEIRLQHLERLPELALECLDADFAELRQLHLRILEMDRRIAAFVRHSEAATRLTDIPGIGVVTASAIVATVGDGRDFHNGRQFAAWLGLVPRQSSTGGVARLGHITKRGDRYLRTLLVHGARSELTRTAHRDDRKSRWAEGLKQRKGWNRSAVALAKKHARIAWALLAKEEVYQAA